MADNHNGTNNSRPTGGDFAAEMSWAALQPLLAKHFPEESESGQSFRKNLKVVEVGCGLGELSYLMQKAGLQVVAIDPSAAVISVARQRGVKDARQCTLEELAQVEEERNSFDVVLFTRSLHHIGEDLEGTLRMVRDDLLRPGGALVIEEFAREDIDRATAEWYYSLHDSLVAAGAIDPQLKQSCHSPDAKQHGHDRGNAVQDEAKHHDRKQPYADEMDAIKRWQRQFKWNNHKMEGIKQLHLGHEMVSAIKRVFGSIDIERQPLLFRFIANHVDRKQRSRVLNGDATPEQDSTYDITRNVWRWEDRMINDSKSILPLGILGIAMTSPARPASHSQFVSGRSQSSDI